MKYIKLFENFSLNESSFSDGKKTIVKLLSKNGIILDKESNKYCGNSNGYDIELNFDDENWIAKYQISKDGKVVDEEELNLYEEPAKDLAHSIIDFVNPSETKSLAAKMAASAHTKGVNRFKL